MYAWIIDTDHLAEGPKDPYDDTGVMGPSQAPDDLLAMLTDNEAPEVEGALTYDFHMYDDDGELYYTGRMITTEGQTERACYGPLGDFGKPNAGCTEIRYPGHADMDCG